jgi:hypothetical protein
LEHQETNWKKVEKQVIKIDSIKTLSFFKIVLGGNCTARVRKKFLMVPKTFGGV